MHDRLIFYALVSMLVISTVWWVYADVVENGTEIKRLEKNLTSIDNNFIMLAKIEESYEDVKEKHAEQIVGFDSLKAFIPTFDAYAEVLEAIRSTANKQAINIESFHPELDDSFPALKTKLTFTKKHIERRPIQLRIYGNFMTIGSFLEELLQLEKTVNIYSILIETELNDSEILSSDIVLFAYIFIDESKKA
ncbi:MAG: type 4a pilus biogenesis protein PilO [Fidelibacterota bacterium]